MRVLPTRRNLSIIAALLAVLSPAVVQAAEPGVDPGVNPGVDRGVDPGHLSAPAPALSLDASTGPSLDGAAPDTGNGSASGIARNPANNTTGSQILSPVPLPTSLTPQVGLFTQFGATLLDDGIDLHGVALDHFLANPTVGNVVGQTYNLGVLAPAVDLDLQRLIGLQGAAVHAQVTFFGLRSNIPTIITKTGGFLTGFQTTPAPSTTPVALSVFTYEQKLLDNTLSIEIGRSNPYRYIALTNSIDPFTFFSSALEVNGDINSPPYPNWGGRVTYHVTPRWSVQGLAFEDNFFRAVNNPDNLGDDSASGVATFTEVDYRSEFASAAYPANAELGLEWNTRHGLSNIEGAAVYATPRTEATDYHGGGVLYFQGQKVVWRGARGRVGPPPNIAIYGSADVGVDKPQPIDFDSIAGVNFTGLIPGRPLDAFEFQVHYQRLSQFEANFETRLQDLIAGPGPSQSRDAYAFEAVANIQALPFLSLRPIAEAFINPDNYYDAAQRRRPGNGFEFGLLGVVPLGALLGTSTKPF